MQTLRVGQGRTKSWDVTLRYAADHPLYPKQAVTSVYSGSEALAVSLDDLAGSPVATSGSSAAWAGVNAAGSAVSGSAAAALGLVRITLDDSDTVALDAGRYGLSLTLTTGGEPVEAYRAFLVVEPR